MKNVSRNNEFVSSLLFLFLKKKNKRKHVCEKLKTIKVNIKKI